MTPTDILPARFTQTADTGNVRAPGAKSGNDGNANGDAGFRDLLKQIAGDKGDPKSTEPNAARSKDTATKHGNGPADAKAALAELRHRQGKDLRVRGEDRAGKGEHVDDAETQALKPSDEPEAGNADAKEANGTPANAVAMLMSLAHRGNGAAQTQGGAKQGGAGSPDQTLASDPAATAVADKAMREVKVVSVKVETHFAAVHTDAATTSFAQRLALAQMSGGTPQTGNGIEAAKPRAEGKQALEATAVTGTEKAGEARASRGQMFAARADHRGADNSGAGGAKAGGDAKPASPQSNAAPTQRSASADAEAIPAGPVQTPMQQLSNRLLATAHELQQAASATPASSVGTDAAASVAPVRVLSINLHPEDLGSVTVRMSMIAGSLDVQIDAEMPDTAQMLRTDTDQITDILRSAGIQIDGITVRAASPDFVSTSSGSTGSFFDQQPSQSQSGGAQSDARGFGNQRREDDPSQAFARSGNLGQDDESRNQRGRGTGLYV